MTSMVETLGSRAIGRIEQTTPECITVRLESDAPSATALNSGSPASFPRVNGYALIPNERGAIACIIASVRTERPPSVDRSGKYGGELVQLPRAARLMELTPVGTLKTTNVGDDQSFSVHRGVDTYPAVGDLVLIPSTKELAAVVAGEREVSHGRMLKVGACPAAELAPVYVDPDKLLGRHLAILGNTGSGKSCSVASIVRSSLEGAKGHRKQHDRHGPPNARFIVLDPNGEYGSNFDDLGVRKFSVDPVNNDEGPLKVPGWLWNGGEWAAFAGAAPGVQRPVLFDALRHLRNAQPLPDSFKAKVWARVRRYRDAFRLRVEKGEHQQQGRREGVADLLENMKTDLDDLADDSACEDSELRNMLSKLAQRASRIEVDARGNAKPEGGHWHTDFAEVKLDGLVRGLSKIGDVVGPDVDLGAVGEDCPRPFALEDLPAYVEALAASRGRDVAAFVDSMNLRIRSILGKDALASVVSEDSSQRTTLAGWLGAHVGEDQAKDGAVAVVDLSLVPSEVVHVVVGVLARMVFEATQRYRRHTGNSLPTTLVLEEAHTFIHRDLLGESAGAGAQACVRVFEKIAREGRKYGLGLVVASQRPSEVAPTVLSQCNTFLLHRLVNDRDQELVRRLVPDGLGSILRELPSLPTRRAVLLGWAAPAPVVLEVEEVPERYRPSSPDPDFWDVWTGQKERAIDWQAIAREWQGE